MKRERERDEDRKGERDEERNIREGEVKCMYVARNKKHILLINWFRRMFILCATIVIMYSFIYI